MPKEIKSHKKYYDMSVIHKFDMSAHIYEHTDRIDNLEEKQEEHENKIEELKTQYKKIAKNDLKDKYKKLKEKIKEKQNELENEQNRLNDNISNLQQEHQEKFAEQNIILQKLSQYHETQLEKQRQKNLQELQREAQKLEQREIKQNKLVNKQKVVPDNITPNYAPIISNDITNIFSTDIESQQVNANLEILKINELIKEGNARLHDIPNKGILLLGQTGSGKSTLTHLLASRELIAETDPEVGGWLIKAVKPLNGIVISHSNASETKVPNKCQINDVVIWDCPGFGDTDAAQEIANAFYIKKLFETTKQLKFVLVVTESEITKNRGISFIDTVKQMIKVFNKIDDLSCSVSLVVTQASNSKQVQQISNIIDRIVEQNEHIDHNTQQMILFLKKSIHLFHEPLEKGIITPKVSILAAISKTTEYFENDTNLANISLTDKAITHSNTLLQIVNYNFNKILSVIVTAIAHPENCNHLQDHNNVFTQNYELIKNWIPSTINYTKQLYPALKNNFALIEQLQSIKNIFNNNKINSYEDGLDIIIKIIQVFEQFASGEDKEILQKQLHDYSYVLIQQFEYIKFFSDLCDRSLPAIDKFSELFDQCHSMISNNLEYQIKTLHIEENIYDSSYYEKLLEYLDMYPNSYPCLNNKAKIYTQLGNIAEKNNDQQKAINNYIKAIEYNSELPEIYSKLGNLFYKQHNYSNAIECYKVVKNSSKIIDCFKKWITQDEESPTIRMMQGDYYVSIGLYESAKKSYHNASCLSNDNDVKLEAFSKIADIMSNNTELAEHFNTIAQQHDYYDYGIVDDQFLDLIGQN